MRGDLLLIDGAGRPCLSQRIVPGGDQRIMRNGLAPGIYRAVVIDRTNGARSVVGTVVAR